MGVGEEFITGNSRNAPIRKKYIENQKSGFVRTFPLVELVCVQIFMTFHQDLEPGRAAKQTNKHQILYI